MKEHRLLRKEDRVLVTGANGFLGTAVVAKLIEYGFRNLRCFVRPSSNVGRLQSIVAPCPVDVEFVKGDLVSEADCAAAAQGVSAVFHLAAGFDKSFAAAFMNSALATRNLVEAFLKFGRPVRFVCVSSFAVYSNLNLRRGAVLDESSPLESNFQERFDAYGFGKLKQEELVREYGARSGLPYVILRPGTIYGPGKKGLTGRIGIDTFGFFVHVGGSNLLPLTYVENCAEAVVLAGIVPDVDGEVFNVVDDELLTSSQFLAAYKKQVSMFSLRVPYTLASAFCRAWEGYSRRTQGQLPPAFNRRRCAAEWKGNRFPNTKIREGLGWKPRVGVAEAMSRYLSQYSQQNG